MLQRFCFFLLYTWTTFVGSPSIVHADVANDAAELLQQSGVSAGFFVHLGAGDGELTAALRQNDATQVHGLLRDVSTIGEIRSRVLAAGHYGDVSFDRHSGSELRYVDNLVNLFVCEDLGNVPREEVLRVLVPNGVAMIKEKDSWTKIIKPRPDNIDHWSHYLHDASGNSVARDDVVAPPRHLQWVGSPRWSRHHDRMASIRQSSFDSAATEVETRCARCVQR